MRVVSFETEGRASWGVLLETGIVDLGALGNEDLKSALTAGNLEACLADVAKTDTALKASEVKLLSPVPNPGKIICIGVNYANRNAEYKDGSKPPKYPSIFMRTAESLTSHGEPLWRPPESPQLDYEGEIVLVIGKAGRRIPEQDAYDHIAGITIMNEGTIRDWVRHAKFNVTQGKNFVHTGAVGPWMVTADEFSPAQYEDMRVTTRVNGELRQNDTTASMLFPFKYIISYCSKFYHLKPGDLIATGTPNGAGARFDPPRYLVPGDVVEVEVEHVGKLVNGVIDEPV